jgi:hypothetical protein
MSAALKLPTPNPEPDPPRAGADTPTRLGRVLGLVRKLIDYGKKLAVTVQQRAGTPGFARFVSPFGTADLAVILARITCGLRRAAMLEARLCRRVERGQELTVAPIRLPAMGAPGATRQPAPPDARPTDPTEDPRLARLPTEEEIAEEVRRRPIGAVIVDICCDLGIAPGDLERGFWDEINHAIIMYGGTSSASSTTSTSGCGPASPTPSPTALNPDGPRHRRDRRCPPPARPEADPGPDSSGLRPPTSVGVKPV